MPYGSHLPSVYPRVYGGTLGFRQNLGAERGLSPRVRGNRRSQRGSRLGYGSIPACTGEPNLERFEFRDHWVYPRVYGGTLELLSGNTGLEGLSPRVRGNQPLGAEHVGYQRSIPACTGEPALCPPSRPTLRVYPRVYGGTEMLGGEIRQCLRSIPACTGEPPWNNWSSRV